MVLAHDPLNIIISGVGGQGNILASDLLSRTFCEEGWSVSVGETYGATQRGGSVVSHVRLSGRHAYGPLIPLGQAHIIIGFEPLEVFRILREHGHESARVVMNDRPLYPLEALQNNSVYPPVERLEAAIRQICTELKVVQGTELAKAAGNAQAQNVVMVGAFAGLQWVPLAKHKYLRPIEETFANTRLAINRKAFELGYRATAPGSHVDA
jgi:indolepyruvate ferredoxin oxidoreductase, beta subunit